MLSPTGLDQRQQMMGAKAVRIGRDDPVAQALGFAVIGAAIRGDGELQRRRHLLHRKIPAVLDPTVASPLAATYLPSILL